MFSNRILVLPPYQIAILIQNIGRRMGNELQLHFLDVGLSNTEGNKLRGRMLTCRHDGANLKVIVEGIETAPDGLTIDPEHGHIYYANMANSATDSGFISRVNIDDKDDMIIVPQGVT